MVVFFDSGLGGLSVLREARLWLAARRFVYLVDDVGFPYGNWEEVSLRERILTLFTHFFKLYKPALCVIACNTASTLVLADLRKAFPQTLFIGTVPAIKPAAEQTSSGLISVLATPGTVARVYTHELIRSFAKRCDVHLVGSTYLAQSAEDYLLQKPIDEKLIAQEIFPAFIEKTYKRTDIVVLACTHYPFLINLFRKYAPWPVDWIDPAWAIAKRALFLLNKCSLTSDTVNMAHSLAVLEKDVAFFTSNKIDTKTEHLLHGFGLCYRPLLI
ncbi:glutamate racemase [Bartonella sp. DGB2]|uniref:glutamate racemase n=1 Tax=Bartonella sp. DGB2 TaxID=3388426 RepID=UPI00398FDAEF